MKKVLTAVRRFCVPGALLWAIAAPGMSVNCVAAPVLPTDGLVIQLDAGTLTGFNDGDEISSWASSVGTGTFTNISDTSKPQYYSSVANLGGQAALYFDADCLKSSGTFGISGANGRTVIAVWADAVNTGANYQHVIHMGNNATDQAYGISVNRKDNTNAVGNHSWGNGANAALKATSAGNTAAFTYTGGKDYFIVNGEYGGAWSRNLNTATNTTLIGSRLDPGASSTEGIKGYVAEVLVYDRPLTGAEMLAVNSYINNKYSLGMTTGIDMDLTGAQISLDFENGNTVTGGQYVGLLTEGENTSLRILESVTKSVNNYAYLSGTNSATGTISGTYDLRFTNSAADGVSFILAGDAVDVTNNYGDAPVGETPSFAGSFGVGYTIYQKNQVALYWDGKQIGTINTTDGNAANPQYDLKSGNWFTTQFQIDYRTGGYGADVDLVLYDTATGGIFGTWSGYVDGLTPGNSQLLLRGRNGGQTTNADFDNIQIKYEDAAPLVTQTWLTDKSGNLNDGANWETGTALPENAVGHITGGTQTIGGFNLLNSSVLIHSGGTTTVSSGLNVGGGSDLNITGGTMTANTTIRIGSDSVADSYIPGSGRAILSVDGGTLNANGYLSIGFSADGVLNLKNGSIVKTGGNAVILGDRDNAQAVYNQFGGTFSSASPILIGNKAGTQAEMNISGGTFTNANTISVGIAAGTADASLNFTGGTAVTKGITVHKGGKLTVGSGVKLTVNSDTTLAHTGLENRFVIGHSTNDPGNKVVISEGATFTSNKTIALGLNAGSYGELVVNGTMNHTVDHFLIGFRGEGKVTVSGKNASVTTKNTILGDNAGGNCVGTLEILDGAKFNASRLSVGDKNTATGTLKIENSTASIGGDIIIGNSGNGTAAITNSTLTGTGTYVVGGAANSGKTAKIVMDASTATITKDVNVGNNGVGHMELLNGSAITTNGSFMVANNAGGAGSTLLIEDSTINVKGAHLLFARNGSSTVTMRGDSVINYSGTGVCGIGEFGDNGVFNMEGGTFNVNSIPKSYDGYALMRTSVQNQSGGTMNIGKKDLAVNLQLKASSQYNLSGGTLNVTGTMNKDSGAKFTMTNDAVLSANNVAFDFAQDGGIVSPGINWDGSDFAIGTTTFQNGYTLNDGGTIRLEVDAENAQADKIIVDGAAVLNGGVIDLVYDPDLLTNGMAFEMLQFNGGVQGLDKIELTLPEDDNYLWNVSWTDTGIVTFSVDGNAVPEPAAWVLLLAGLGLGSCTLRNRKK